MTTGFTSEMLGKEKLVARFDNYVGKLQTELTTTLESICAYLVDYVVRNKLSGQVLHRRTGTLSRSIQYAVSYASGRLTGAVRSRSGGNAPLAYAGYHEYGFHGAVNVRAHVRKIAAGDFAGELTPVRDYVRHVNYAGHPFMRPTLAENQTYINDRLRGAVTKVNRV